MTENENLEPTVEETYLAQIGELKAKMDQMVDPEEYKKLKGQHDKLLNDYVNKRPAPKKEEPKIRPAVEVAKELIKIQDGDISNRAYIQKSLEYRQAYIKEFGTDPWTDFTVNGSSAPNEQTERVAKALQQLVDENESPVSFRIALNDMLRDDPAVIAALRDRDKQAKRTN